MWFVLSQNYRGIAQCGLFYLKTTEGLLSVVCFILKLQRDGSMWFVLSQNYRGITLCGLFYLKTTEGLLSVVCFISKL